MQARRTVPEQQMDERSRRCQMMYTKEPKERKLVGLMKSGNSKATLTMKSSNRTLNLENVLI